MESGKQCYSVKLCQIGHKVLYVFETFSRLSMYTSQTDIISQSIAGALRVEDKVN